MATRPEVELLFSRFEKEDNCTYARITFGFEKQDVAIFKKLLDFVDQKDIGFDQNRIYKDFLTIYVNQTDEFRKVLGFLKEENPNLHFYHSKDKSEMPTTRIIESFQNLISGQENQQYR